MTPTPEQKVQIIAYWNDHGKPRYVEMFGVSWEVLPQSADNIAVVGHSQAGMAASISFSPTGR